MNLKIQARHLGKLIQESSPTILTAVGVVGVVGTAVLVGKAAYKSGQYMIIDGETRASSDETPRTPKETFLMTYKFYLPAVGVGSLTIAAIIASNRIHARRLAALAAGYAILSKDFDEYREKAYEMLGVKKSDELDKDLAAKKMDKAPIPAGSVLPDGKTWFCDMSTMRYFPSTMESVKWAINNVNHKLNNQGDVSLNNFYEELDLETTEIIGDMLGWSPGMKVDVRFVPILTDQYGAVTAFKFTSGAAPKYAPGK